VSAAGQKKKPTKSRGAALVIVLWAIGVLGLIAAQLASNARIDLAEARIAEARLLSEAATESGLRLGLVRWDDGYEFDRQHGFGCKFSGGTMRISVVPASARIDLNFASESTLTMLLTGLGETDNESRRLAAALIDYRDADNIPRPFGAEAESYNNPERPIRNRPFTHVNELSFVNGFDDRIMELLRPHVTVYAATPSIDLFYADSTLRSIAARASEFTLGYSDMDISPNERLNGEGVDRIRSKAILVTAIATMDTGRRSGLEGVFGAVEQGTRSRPLLDQRAIAPPEGTRMPNEASEPCW